MGRLDSGRPIGLCLLALACSLLLACGDDASSISDMGVVPGQPCSDEGATATADDGCNTCTCEAGEWRCTARGCIRCPDPAQYDGACDTVVVYARDPDSALCCEYGSPCTAPESWDQFFTMEECEGGSASDDLEWYTSCGAPVCGPGSDVPTGASLCTDQVEGEPCEDEGGTCDPGTGCGVNLVCAAEDPKTQPGGCPISRARFKRDITYVSDARRARLAQDLLALPLATWRYREGDGSERLGFIIEDVEPSPSVDSARDRVDLYGYTTMAVAALQEQSRELAALRAEVAALRAALQNDSMCGPAP